MADIQPAIAIMPHHVKHRLRPGRVALDALVWPLGRPERLRGSDKMVRDLAAEDHLAVFSNDVLYFRPWSGTRAKVSVLVTEPAAIHGRHMKWLRRRHQWFHKVLTANPDLLEDIPNGVLFPQGCTWVSDWRELDRTKTNACSLIASDKRALEGHQMRHSLVEYARAEDLDVDVMGRGYKPFYRKSDGLAPYRFSVVIENVRERNYFTEKLVDAVLCRCVPIYWGCPNLEDFIDTSGMILCETEDDVKAAMQDFSQARYDALLPGLERAVPQVAEYTDIHDRVAAVLTP